MNTAGTLAAYGAALVLVAGGGWVIGNAVGPVADSAAAPDAPAVEAGIAEEPVGLASSKDGYTLTPASTTLAPGSTQDFSFRIVGPGGEAVTDFDVEHEKRMHVIVVRRDTADFQHVHPELAADGTWTVPLNLPEAGSYRAFADFAPSGGEATTLGVDLAAPGDFQPVTYSPSRVADVDGYQVRLDGDLVPGQSSKVTLTVGKDGREVTDLQPYLGAYGHLVALRGGDLAYLHVHPDGEPGDGKTAPGPAIGFYAEVPSAGTYRLFLDFQHEGTVRTAEFTLGTTNATPAPAAGDGHGGHG